MFSRFLGPRQTSFDRLLVISLPLTDIIDPQLHRVTENGERNLKMFADIAKCRDSDITFEASDALLHPQLERLIDFLVSEDLASRNQIVIRHGNHGDVKPNFLKTTFVKRRPNLGRAKSA